MHDARLATALSRTRACWVHHTDWSRGGARPHCVVDGSRSVRRVMTLCTLCDHRASSLRIAWMLSPLLRYLDTSSESGDCGLSHGVLALKIALCQHTHTTAMSHDNHTHATGPRSDAGTMTSLLQHSKQTSIFTRLSRTTSKKHRLSNVCSHPPSLVVVVLVCLAFLFILVTQKYFAHLAVIWYSHPQGSMFSGKLLMCTYTCSLPC